MNYLLLFTLLVAIVLVFIPGRSSQKKKQENSEIDRAGKTTEISSNVEVHS
jgi:hypothetical protein